MNLEKEMRKAETKEYNTYTEKYDSGTGDIDIVEAISIAKQYAEDMCKKQRKICAYESLTMSSSTEINILNAPLATESK